MAAALRFGGIFGFCGTFNAFYKDNGVNALALLQALIGTCLAMVGLRVLVLDSLYRDPDRLTYPTFKI